MSKTDPPKESAIVDNIVRHLRERPECWVAKMHGGAFGTAGIPDLVVVEAGRTFWFEVKRPGRHATAHQDRMHQRIRAAGGIVHVVHSWFEVSAVLDGQNQHTTTDKALATLAVMLEARFQPVHGAPVRLWRLVRSLSEVRQDQGTEQELAIVGVAPVPTHGAGHLAPYVNIPRDIFLGVREFALRENLQGIIVAWPALDHRPRPCPGWFWPVAGDEEIAWVLVHHEGSSDPELVGRVDSDEFRPLGELEETVGVYRQRSGQVAAHVHENRVSRSTRRKARRHKRELRRQEATVPDHS